MALDTVKLMRRRIFAAATESTPGTAGTINAGAASFNAYDLKIVGDVPFNERQRQGGFGNYVGTPGAQKGTLSFWTELTGVGSGAGNHATLLLGCGMTAAANTYSLDATANQTLTLAGYFDGRLKKLTGAMGNVVFTFKNGEPCKAEWTFSGVWNAPIDSALVSPTYPTIVPPRSVSTAVLIGGTQYYFPELKLDIGNNVIMREDISATGGYRCAWITNRLPKVTVAPEALALATKDWYAAYLASTQYALSVVLGSVAGNIATITAAALQQDKMPGVDDRNGVLVDGLSFEVLNDSLSIAFT